MFLTIISGQGRGIFGPAGFSGLSYLLLSISACRTIGGYFQRRHAAFRAAAEAGIARLFGSCSSIEPPSLASRFIHLARRGRGVPGLFACLLPPSIAATVAAWCCAARHPGPLLTCADAARYDRAAAAGADWIIYSPGCSTPAGVRAGLERRRAPAVAGGWCSSSCGWASPRGSTPSRKARVVAPLEGRAPRPGAHRLGTSSMTEHERDRVASSDELGTARRTRGALRVRSSAGSIASSEESRPLPHRLRHLSNCARQGLADVRSRPMKAASAPSACG